MQVQFIAPKNVNGGMPMFTQTTEQLEVHNAVQWAKGDAVFASFSPMRRLTSATYVKRTEQGHKVRLDSGSLVLVSFVFSPEFAAQQQAIAEAAA